MHLPDEDVLHRQVLDVSVTYRLVVSADDVVQWAGARAGRSVRWGGSLVGRPVLDLVAGDDRGRARALATAARTTGSLLLDTLQVAGEPERRLEVAVQQLGEGLLVEGWDVTEREQREHALRSRALQDPLTGVPNRALLLDRLAQALLPRRAEPLPLGVLFLDLDGFKDVNDRWGHAVGDAALVDAATCLTGALRPGDTLGRLGGDEFAVVCPQVDDPATLSRVGVRLLETLRGPRDVGGHRLQLRASVGGVLSDGSGSPSPDELLAVADAAMYDAKADGGDRVRLRPLHPSGVATP